MMKKRNFNGAMTLEFRIKELKISWLELTGVVVNCRANHQTKI